VVTTTAQIQPAKALSQNRLSVEQNQVLTNFMEAEFGKDAAALIHIHSPRVKIQYLNSESKPV
jgi:hypothetical protein